MTSVTDTLLNLLNTVLAFLPRIVNAAILLIVGYIIARLVRTGLTKGLRALHFDRVADRAGITRFLQMAGTQMDAARVLAVVAFWWIFLFFVEMALNALELVQITGYVNAILGYLPNVFAAVLIVVIGALIANIVADVVRGAAGGAGLAAAPLLATAARWAILIFAVLSALTQLNVAPNMIFILFAAFVGMLAIAGGLAFGLGGVDAARGLLSGMSSGSMLQPGQRVQIGQHTGTVLRHDLNTTVVDTGAGQISIPNSELSHERITMLGTDGMQPRQPASAS
ncbi:MAG TPA: mechanosensitive ion channel domain-containing protein [Ktedonobacterales bacterium]|nr:mechanosensitive ion channel domain-containing protein [Ktedonobacterales bacterium]